MMAKAALLIATILLLTLSGGLATHSHQVAFSQRHVASLTIASSDPLAAGRASTLALPDLPDRSPSAPADEDGPAPALLAYLALILIGSSVAVGLVRRSYRRQL